MRILKGCCLILLALFFYFCSDSTAYGQVIINEVHPAPSTGNDWIELYNPTIQVANLTGWTIEDSASTLTTTPTLSGQILSSHGFLVVEVGNRLNNSGDQVKFVNPNGEILDFFTYESSVIDQSWSRLIDGYGNMNLAQPTRGYSNLLASPLPSLSPTPLPSPSPSPSPLAASPSISPTPTVTVSPTSTLPTHIVISEVMACPNTNETEWVELQNLDDSSYTLANWQLRDSQNNTRYFSSPIAAGGLEVIQISPGMLNNTGGDQLSIVRPDGTTTSWMSYLTCTKGKSLISNGQSWAPAEPTPGNRNPDTVVIDQSDDSDNTGTGIEEVIGTQGTSAVLATGSTQRKPINLLPPVVLSNPTLPLSSSVSTQIINPLSTSSAAHSTVKVAPTTSIFTSKQQNLPAIFLIIGSLLILFSCVWYLHTCYTEKSEKQTPFFE
ncbi:hypothetical protein BH10PAT2_BH10PAT2_1180 [soil metagenome]